MGSLTPGATYIYERHDGVTYAREAGADPMSRVAVGWDYNSQEKVDTVFGAPMTIIAEMVEVYEAAKTNPALQQALEHAIMLHRLSKEYERQT